MGGGAARQSAADLRVGRHRHTGHLAGELLKLKLDSKLVHVPYKGAGPALIDVAGGQVDFYFPGYPGAVPLVQSGKVKMLAISTANRSPLSPDTPTVAEATEIPDFDFTLWAGFFGPRALPMDIATRLNVAINKVIAEPRHQGAIAADRRRRGAVVDQPIHRFRPQRDRPLSDDHQGGRSEAGMS